MTVARTHNRIFNHCDASKLKPIRHPSGFRQCAVLHASSGYSATEKTSVSTHGQAIFESKGYPSSGCQPHWGSCAGRWRQTAECVCCDGNNQSCLDFHHTPLIMFIRVAALCVAQPARKIRKCAGTQARMSGY